MPRSPTRSGTRLRHPERVAPYVRRAGRDAWLRVKHPDHVGYYRAVMASDTRRNPEAAVGSRTIYRWLALGRMQFDYLVEHGLRPEHRMLDIGCGNLRGGWRFIDHLDTGHYYGIDISPDILIAAKQTLTERGLQAKLPHLTITGDLRLGVPARRPLRRHPRAQRLLALAAERHRRVPRARRTRALPTETGFFDFTFDRTEGTEHQVLREDFYYRTDTLLTLACPAPSARAVHGGLGGSGRTASPRSGRAAHRCRSKPPVA
ncbi:hypothetical protein SVIOM342S_02693 [Streptomyces violaceorubidus]